MKTKIVGYYSIFISVAIIGYWIMTLTTGAYQEGKIEISFHVFSEILMALTCLISGILLIMNKNIGGKINIIGLSMILYSVLNAAGYFGERNEWSLTAMFVSLFVVTSVMLVFQVKLKY
jgi:hypothetical protein